MHKSRSSVKISIWSPDNDAAAKGFSSRISKLTNRLFQRLRPAAQWPMGNRRGWLLLCLAATGGLALLILLKAAYLLNGEIAERAQGDQYAVYIDGGSSGTRVRVFRYRPAKWPSYVELMLPEPSHSVEPGLSAYASQSEKAAASLAPLLEFAYDHVPPDLWHRTPVRLLATAGLRLLSSDEQQAILAACHKLLVASHFRFKPDWATVIDGEMEGLFGWAAVNYITGALQEASGHALHSRKEVIDPSQLFTGLLEMGGASMQVTFLPPASARVPEKHGSHLHLPGVPSRLFTHSYLGLGMDSALARAAEYTLQRQPRSPAISDPCLPTGYISDDGRYGNGSFAQCLAIVQQIMPEHNCSFSGAAHSVSGGLHPTVGSEDVLPYTFGGYADDLERSASQVGILKGPGDGDGGCVLQGSYVPALAGQFVAMENFAWTAKALGLPENATLRQLHECGRRYCAKHWSSLHAEFSGHIPDQFLIRYCFGAAYILVLLHHGFGLGLDDDRLRWTNTVREGGNGAEVGLNWVLGAAVVDAMSGVNGWGGMGHGRQGQTPAGGHAVSGGGVTGSQHFWLRDEHGMAAAGAGARMALLLPLATLATLAVFVGLALLRALRGRKARIVALMGSGGVSSAFCSSRGIVSGVEEGSRLGSSGSSGAGGVATALSSSSLVSEGGISERQMPTSSVRDASSIDPGLGPSQGPDARQRGQGPAYTRVGQTPVAAHEVGSVGVRHGGVLKAAALLGSAMRRNSSFTSVFIGVDNGTSQ
ncbi:hypothetical protein Vretimale_4620 [Volvox reticuliferus]|uniref:Apyrase n=1 Tax=Volvox reticuliferus TaxID=1737510 RepID=A0A8J4DBD5_9CHLO|nr:hypothetical protein Vretimale_4620 [Volvox reticuliferus]